MQLEPCPFCGGEAERLELTDEDNFGGSVICCKQCGASSSVHFDRKENLEDGWNRRVQAVQPVPVGTVKPLEWRDHRGHTFPDTWTALTPCGVFEIEERSAGDSPAYFATGPMYAFIADKDSLEEAKAAAQADYERRISAALTATASAEPVAIPDGWKLVPVKPTNEMVSAVRDIAGAQAAAYGLAAWDTMLKAAPVSGGDNAK